MKLNHKGFTLIELLMGLGLTAIVIALVFSQYLFGANVMAKGQQQQDIQFQLRMVADFITIETRNALELELINTADISATADDYNYIYLEGGMLKYRAANSTVVKNKTGAIIQNESDFSLATTSNSNRCLLSFKMKGSQEEQVYELDSMVFLNNIIATSIVGDKRAVRYKKV